jgi:tetratricopeptide (TPR) repeat protein
MDSTAALRAKGPAIEEMQHGETELGARKFREAAGHFKAALAREPDDYTGLLLMAKAQYGLENFSEMDRYAAAARDAYPAEAQGWHIGGMARLLLKRYDEAYRTFRRSGELLPGNPNVLFFMGLCREKTQRIREAAAHYDDFLKKGGGGDYGRYALNRLREWGYR